MKIWLWVSLALFSGSTLQAQVGNTTEARVKTWLKQQQLTFYANRAKDPAVQTFLRLYDKLESEGILCASRAAAPQALKLNAERTSEETVRINWQATTDQTVEGYILERSFQKDGPYERVYYLRSTGPANRIGDYQFLDNNSFAGKSYYRVVQVMAAGKQKQEKTVAQGYDTEFTVKAYPNPSAGRFGLAVQSRRDELLQIRVVDVLGRLVEQKNNLPANQLIEIGQQYRTGVYFVQVIQGAKTKTLRLEKAEAKGN